jgi:hypothetical protein
MNSKSFFFINNPYHQIHFKYTLVTGTYIHEEVIWQNKSEIIGIRLLTAPVEDKG